MGKEQNLQEEVAQFHKNRPIMDSFNTPLNMTERIKGEVDELLAEIKWGEKEPTPEEVERVADELADVMICGFSLGDCLGIDVEAAVRKKLAKNETRFPKELFQEGDFQTVYLTRKRELGEIKQVSPAAENDWGVFNS